MNLFKKIAGVSCCLVAGVAMVSLFTANVNAATGSTSTTLQVAIQGGDVNIYATGAFDFGTYSVSSTAQTVTGVFTDYFSVEDLKGADSGYYTTLQLGGDLTGPGGAVISSGSVSASVATTGVTLISGTANTRVEIPASLLTYSSLDTARTYIKRDSAANDGVVGHYGAYPQLQVIIPAFAAVGTYTGTLTYTLFEN